MRTQVKQRPTTCVNGCQPTSVKRPGADRARHRHELAHYSLREQVIYVAGH